MDPEHGGCEYGLVKIGDIIWYPCLDDIEEQ